MKIINRKNENIKKFLELSKIFSKHNFSLYMVGGTSRDYLLGISSPDLDLASDATPDEMKKFLPEFKTTFAKLGNLHYKNIDITTFRIEGNYKDYRHPSFIKFTRNIKDDYKRRDFTINAIYIDKDLNVIDFTNGLDDLNNKIIRFIGNPTKRIKEDPLRILRALRFSKKLNFKIETKSLEAINKYGYLLEKLNKNKVKSELKKS